MVASGVLPVGTMRPRLSASSVTSRVVRGRLADFRTASAAARKVISSDGNEGSDGLAAATSSAAARQPGSPGVDRLGSLGQPQARHLRSTKSARDHQPVAGKLKLRYLLRYRSASEVPSLANETRLTRRRQL
jgi:hypothetical protein